MQEPVNPGYEQPAIRQPVSSQPIGFGPTPQPVQCSACGAKVSKTQKINCRCGLLFKGAVQGKLASNHDFLSPFVIITGSPVLLENEENGVFKQPLFLLLLRHKPATTCQIDSNEISVSKPRPIPCKFAINGTSEIIAPPQ